jgi:hypothetical protein
MDMYIYIIINNYIHIYRHYTYTHMLHDFYPCVKQLEYWWFSTPFICAGKWATAAVLLQARTHARSEAAVRLAAKGTRRPVGPWDRSTARRSSGLGVHGIDVLFPFVGWSIEGFERLPLLTTGKFDDRWYTSPRPLYFYQKDIIEKNSSGSIISSRGGSEYGSWFKIVG